MARSDSQELLDRVLAYLALSGYVMTPATERRALQLVGAVLAEAAPDGTRPATERLLDLAMNQLPLYFTLPRPVSPQIDPPINRGSIGYGPRV